MSRYNLLISLAKGTDADIAAWFSEISYRNQSRCVWVSAMIYAFAKRKELETGYSQSMQYDHSEFELLVSRDESKIKKWDVSSRGVCLRVELTNKYIQKLWDELKAEGYSFSGIIKEMVRKGESEYGPNIARAYDLLCKEDGSPRIMRASWGSQKKGTAPAERKSAEEKESKKKISSSKEPENELVPEENLKKKNPLLVLID